MASVSAHLAISERFLNQGIAEVAAGDLLQGSEKLWGAAAHIVKAAAEKRSWQHNGHRFLYRTVRGLVSISGDSRLTDGFRSAGQLHLNFYEDVMNEDEVSDRAREVSEFVDMINAIVHD